MTVLSRVGFIYTWGFLGIAKLISNYERMNGLRTVDEHRPTNRGP